VSDEQRVPTIQERRTIRDLGARWAELAADPVMADRKRQWRALHDLRPERPMILIETQTIDGFVAEDELLCADPMLRVIERILRDHIRHVEEVGDDIVLEPYYRIGWDLVYSDWGVDVVQEPAEVSQGEIPLGYTFNFPIKDPADVSRLLRRTFSVDREATARRKRLLEDTFGDILPVRLGNYDHFRELHGVETFLGNYFLGLTWQIYRFTGNDGLLYWLLDSPDTIHWLMEYMTSDRERMFDVLEREGLIVPNTDTQMAGPRAYGYVSELPGPDTPGPLTLKDVWCWAESQETTMVSPQMYREFFLPYLARLTDRFGLVYYGCCEPVDDRLESIMEAMPNLRSVSVSSWADFRKVGEMLGRRNVYSRKPNPVPLSGPTPDWARVEDDLQRTHAAARDCNVELLFRDIYTIAGDWPRLGRWAALARSIFGM
jgi:hypothetical protein